MSTSTATLSLLVGLVVTLAACKPTYEELDRKAEAEIAASRERARQAVVARKSAEVQREVVAAAESKARNDAYVPPPPPLPPTPARRAAFADTYDTTLLGRHLNPDGVTAAGPDKTTLAVRGWFCSRQFIFDFTNGSDGASAQGVGFKRITCASALENWSQDL